MTKSELAEALSSKLNLPMHKSNGIIATILESITGELVKGGNVEIRGFGTFTVREYKSYEGRNPKTKEITIVKPKKLPYFKVGKELKKSVDAGGKK